jgi:hypothetical protein
MTARPTAGETDAEIRLRVLRAAAGPLDFAAAEAAAIDMGREALALLGEMEASQAFSCDCGIPEAWFARANALLARARGDA